MLTKFGLGSVSGSGSIPTVTDNLFAQGTIGADVLGMLLPPYSSNDAGSLSFGAADASKYSGQLNYVPVTQVTPAADYWGVDQSVVYGNTTILSSTAGIVDSGTTMVSLATGVCKAHLPSEHPCAHGRGS